MKIVIDAVDKIHGDVVPGVVEKMQHTLAKLFGREEKSIIAHMFIHDLPTSFHGVQVGAIGAQLSKVSMIGVTVVDPQGPGHRHRRKQYPLSWLYRGAS